MDNDINKAIRPTMSMVATVMIGTGSAQACTGDYNGYALMTAGCLIYILKAYLYKKGVFTDLKEDNDGEGV